MKGRGRRKRELTEEKDGDNVSLESVGDGRVDGRTVEDGSDRDDGEVGLPFPKSKLCQ